MASGPETRLLNHMRKDAAKIYGERLVLIKHHGDQYAKAGVSDLLGCLDGTFFACEVKAPESYGNNVERALSEGPTTLQKAFIGHVQAANGYGWVAATREQFLEGLAAIDAGNRLWCDVCCHPEEYLYCPKHPVTEPTNLA